MATFEHGASAYANGRCRCDICRAANTRRVTRRRAERFQLRTEVNGRRVAAVTEHGSLSAYNNWGCRCEDCCKAWSDYQGARRKMQKAAAS